MKSLQLYIQGSLAPVNESLNEKSALDIINKLYNAGKIPEGHLPQDLVDYLVKNGKELDSYNDMVKGKSYLVLIPRAWHDEPEMGSLSYYKDFIPHENRENKKPESWEYTFISKAERLPGKFKWSMCTNNSSGSYGTLPGGCGIEHLDKNQKPGFYIQHYYIIEVTPKLEGFAEAVKKL